jgi:tetratricopeptide (TPR) repeat protein
LADAAKLYAKAIRTQTELCSRQNGSLAKRSLATTHNNLGLLLAETKAVAEAQASYVAAIDLLKPGPDGTVDAQDQLLLASVLSNLSGLLCDSDPERAVKYAAEALANQTDALQNDRRKPKLATKVIVTLNTLGAAQTKNGDFRAAVVTLNRAIDISQQLLAQWPDQSSYKRDLVISLNHLGLAHSRLGELVEARVAFEQALEHQRPLAIQFPSDAVTHSMLGGVLNNLGFLHRQLGDTQAAVTAYSEAAEEQSIATQLAPEVDRYRTYLEKHQHNLASLGESS